MPGMADNQRLADDLRAAFPGMRGALSRSNISYMRATAEACPGGVVQQRVVQLPWVHVTALLGWLGKPKQADWYAVAA